MKLNKGFRPSPIMMREQLKNYERMQSKIKNVKTTINNKRKNPLFRPTVQTRSKFKLFLGLLQIELFPRPGCG